MKNKENDVQNSTESAENNTTAETVHSTDCFRLIADGSAAWNDLSGFQRDMLESIAALEKENEEPYGLAIKHDLERDYGDVNHGRLYPNLDELVEYGFVDKNRLDKRTNEYALTDAARRMLEHRTLRLADSLDLSVESSSQAAVTDGGSDVE